MSRRNRPPADALDRLRLARAEGVGPVAYRRMLTRYGSAAAALDALPVLARAGGRPAPPTVPSADDAERELHALDRLGACMIFAGEPDYPPLLALLDDAPAGSDRPGRCGVAGKPRDRPGGRPQRLRQWPAHGREPGRRAGSLAGGGLRPRARHRRRRPYRRPPDRSHHRGGGRRSRQSLPAGTRRSAAPHRGGRRRGHRGTARHRAPGAPLPTPQPHHRRPGPRRRGGGGGAALRQPDHRAPRPGGRPGAVRGARIAARSALTRRQRSDPPGRAPHRDGAGRARQPAGPPIARRAGPRSTVRSGRHTRTRRTAADVAGTRRIRRRPRHSASASH